MQLIATDNRKVVVGLGVTGLSCARYFANKNQTFSVVDSRANPPGLEAFQQEFPEVKMSLGEISDEALAGAAQLIVSPGISLEEPAIKRAIENGVVVCGDIDLFRSEVSSPIVAITGSNGKSTVTTLVGEMAKQAGLNVGVGGNIGLPALQLLEDSEHDIYVLELSSFQLERAGKLDVDVATVLNISADHMDRYDSMVAYHQAKHRIFRGCKKAVINRQDPLTKPLVPDDVELFTFGLDKPDFKGFGLLEENGQRYLAYEFTPLMPVSELKIVGSHNIANALAALALGYAAGFGIEPMLDALRVFSGLEHRCQFVDRVDEVSFYNDSKGTNVGASIAAMQGLSEVAGKIVLIAGGEAKDADFSPMLPTVKAHCRAVVLIGDATVEMAELFDGHVKVLKAESMDAAVQLASIESQSNDAVLLSPACASFDMFDNYQHRGTAFIAAVKTLAQGRGV